MGVISWGIHFSELSDELENEIINAGFDPMRDWTFAYDGIGSSQPKYTEAEAKEELLKYVAEIQQVIDQKIPIAKTRFCLCCPEEVYEAELI